MEQLRALPTAVLLHLSQQLNIPLKSVVAVISLLDEGATVPFIARYRKEATGNLDEVQIRDIQIPASLMDAMSRYAQAERESAARVLLGESEKKVAKSFAEAAQIYEADRNGMQLRGMNMLFEVMKGGNGTIVVVPSSALDAMNLGGIVSAGVAARNGQQ